MLLICLGGFLDYTADKYVNEPTKINSEFSVFLRVAPILSICLGILLHLNIFINFVISQNYKSHIILVKVFQAYQFYTKIECNVYFSEHLNDKCYVDLILVC